MREAGKQIWALLVTISQLPLVLHCVLIVVIVGGGLALQEAGFRYVESRFVSGIVTVIPDYRRALCPAVQHSIGTARQHDEAEIAKNLARMLPGLKELHALSEAHKARIADQAYKAQRVQCMHAQVLLTYGGNFYASAMTTMAFMAISAVTLFLVGRNGWQQANPFLVNTMITAAVLAAFYGVFPKLFKQEEMVNAHKEQLLRYESLLDAMASYTAAGNAPSGCNLKDVKTAPTSPPRLDAPAFIACVDTALAALVLPFALDLSQRPDFHKLITSVTSVPNGGQATSEGSTGATTR